MKKNVPCVEHYETIKMPDEVPTLEEFVKILKSDEYCDPRYKNKRRHKSRRLALRYFTEKRNAHLPGNTKSVTAAHTASRISSVSSLKNRGQLDTKSTGHPSYMPSVPESCHGLRGQLFNETIQKRAQEVRIVTDSVPCKDHYLKHTRRQSVMAPTRQPITTPVRRHSVMTPVNNPYGTSQIPCGASRKLMPIGNMSIKITSASPIFQRRSICEDDNDSSESEVEESESEEEEEQGDFDTKKLNFRYSIERIRKKRRSKNKKKPVFIEVLAKYYNMQSTLSTLRKNSPSTEPKPKKPRVRANSLGGKILQLATQQKKKEKVKPIIGKLKSFKFLETKPKKKLNLDKVARGDFAFVDLVKFHEQLKEMLDKFVVRREIVVSDLQTFYHATTSVTFTRIPCFHYREKDHEHEPIVK